MTDIIERLEQWASIAGQGSIVNGTLQLQNDLREAVAEIKNLRGLGIAAVGPSFAELTKDVARRSTEPPDPS